MSEQLLVERVLHRDGESDAVDAVQHRVYAFASEDELAGLLFGALARHSVEKLLDQVVHVEELVQVLLLIKNCHDLPNLLALLHDRAEQRNGVAHRLCSLVAG